MSAVIDRRYRKYVRGRDAAQRRGYNAALNVESWVLNVERFFHS